MITKIINVTGNEVSGNDDWAKEAAQVIRAGGLVAFPTETVYGLGANGLDEEAAKKIYAAKGRPSDNPLILHISEFSEIKDIVKSVPDVAKKLADAFWPGPMTMVFEKADIVPYGTTGGLDTVAVRCPSHKVARALIKTSGVPIAAPSANASGRPSPTLAEHVKEDMDGKIELIIDGGACDVGLESTIVDVTGPVPMILRPGYITKAMLEKVVGKVEVDPVILATKPDPNLKPKAPGMKYRHYAPKADMTIFEGKSEDVVSRINAETERLHAEGKKVGVMCSEETKAMYKGDIVFSAGKRSSEAEVAHNLFNILREFDECNVDYIFAESFESDDLGMAIMNRLIKAAGYKKTRV